MNPHIKYQSRIYQASVAFRLTAVLQRSPLSMSVTDVIVRRH